MQEACDNSKIPEAAGHRRAASGALRLWEVIGFSVIDMAKKRNVFFSRNQLDGCLRKHTNIYIYINQLLPQARVPC